MSISIDSYRSDKDTSREYWKVLCGRGADVDTAPFLQTHNDLITLIVYILVIQVCLHVILKTEVYFDCLECAFRCL